LYPKHCRITTRNVSEMVSRSFKRAVTAVTMTAYLFHSSGF
jgi:hypothetical protein